MTKLKIRFLKHYEQFDEELIVFEKGQVISLEEHSSRHYVSRGVAVLAKANEKIGKPKKQEELPIEENPKIGQKILNWFKKSKASDEVDLESLDVPELSDLAKEIYPGTDLPDSPAKGRLIAFIETGDVSVFAKPDDDPANPDEKTGLASKSIPELVAIANEKYPGVKIPDVFLEAQLIAFIGTGDVAVFGPSGDAVKKAGSAGSRIADWFKKSKPGGDVDLEGLEVSELLEIAKESYPDTVLPEEPGKAKLIAFIEGGDVSVFDVSDDQ